MKPRQTSLIAGALGILAMTVMGVTPSGAGIHLELQFMAPKAESIPGFCSTWHEIYPLYCTSRHQDGYVDQDNDGMLSVCDEIILDDEVNHIDWVGPTYWLDRNNDGVPDAAYEPQSGDPTSSPVCTFWMQVWPIFGTERHVDGWEDGDGDGQPSVCDFVHFQGDPSDLRYHIVRIGVNIVVTPTGVSAGEATWGETKSHYDHPPHEDQP